MSEQTNKAGCCLSREEIAQIVRDTMPDVTKPDMRIGVEVPINRRMYGKQVYAQLINLGALPNKATKTINHNIPNVDWIQIDPAFSTVTEASTGKIRLIVYANATSTTSNWSCFATKTQVCIGTGANRTNHSAIICLQYTKTTDEAA